MYGGIGGYQMVRSVVNTRVFKKAKKRQRLLVNALNETTTITAQVPPSGSYDGTSSESDNGDQDIRTTLRFAADGSITGNGRDSTDGPYTVVDGAWAPINGESQPTVAWTEKYSRGFEVVVKGTFLQDGTIKARFTSSLGVRGTFVLQAPVT